MLWGLFKLYCIIVLRECTLIVPHQRVLLDLIEAEGQEEHRASLGSSIMRILHTSYFIFSHWIHQLSASAIFYQFTKHFLMPLQVGRGAAASWSGSTRLGWINYYGNHRWLLFKLRRCLPAYSREMFFGTKKESKKKADRNNNTAGDIFIGNFFFLFFLWFFLCAALAKMLAFI